LAAGVFWTGIGAAAILGLCAACLSTGEGPRAATDGANRSPVYHSPQDVAFSPDGSRLAVSDRTAGEWVLADAASRERFLASLPAYLGSPNNS
jgi:hypothetical protein